MKLQHAAFYLVDACRYFYISGRPEWEPIFRCKENGEYQFTPKFWFGNEKTFMTRIDSFRRLMRTLETPESGYSLAVVPLAWDGPMPAHSTVASVEKFKELCAMLPRFTPSPRLDCSDPRMEWVDEDGLLWKAGRHFKDKWRPAMGEGSYKEVIASGYPDMPEVVETI